MRVEENENVENFLEHFGVKGMRWGHRKAPVSGGQYLQAKARSRIDKQINRHKTVRDGKGLVKVATALDRYTWGRKGRFEAYQNMQIAQLENKKKEIEQGRKVVSTILFGAQYSPTRALRDMTSY